MRFGEVRSLNSRTEVIEDVTLKLLAHCRSNDWAGHDPYDALNTDFLRLFPILNNRIPRLLLTQLLKRSPVDLRSVMRIPKTQNPKALGLFLTSMLRLKRLGLLIDIEPARPII